MKAAFQSLAAAPTAFALILSSTPATATTPASALPPMTWDIVDRDEEEIEYEENHCLDWDDVPLSQRTARRPNTEANSAADRDEDDVDILVDENDVPILDEFGNFIGCDTGAAIGWLTGPTPYLIGAFVLSQIALFAGGGGGNSGSGTTLGGPADSPG